MLDEKTKEYYSKINGMSKEFYDYGTLTKHDLDLIVKIQKENKDFRKVDWIIIISCLNQMRLDKPDWKLLETTLVKAHEFQKLISMGEPDE